MRESTEITFSTVVIGELLFGLRNGSRFERNAHELDELLAQERVVVLSATRPGSTSAAQPSQVKFETEPRALENARGSVSKLLARHPLYPQLDLL